MDDDSLALARRRRRAHRRLSPPGLPPRYAIGSVNTAEVAGWTSLDTDNLPDDAGTPATYGPADASAQADLADKHVDLQREL